MQSFAWWEGKEVQFVELEESNEDRNASGGLLSAASESSLDDLYPK
jgi:hypothetical protein